MCGWRIHHRRKISGTRKSSLLVEERRFFDFMAKPMPQQVEVILSETISSAKKAKL